jgi:hypothetical protein
VSCASKNILKINFLRDGEGSKSQDFLNYSFKLFVGLVLKVISVLESRYAVQFFLC